MKKYIILISFVALAFAMPNGAHAAKMALSPASGEFHTGCATAISIIVNTEGEKSTAADAFLHYNPDQIDIIDQLSSVGGVQLRPGSIYESYPGNITTNGAIRLTAFNREGFFNGRGVLASIVIKGKPGVDKADLWFDFAPGRTTDSNVANPNSDDIMNAAYGGSYRFTTGSCGADATPPFVESPKPANGAYGVAQDTDIKFTIRDNASGVDVGKLKVWVNDTLYQNTDGYRFEYTGKPTKYEIKIQPKEPFVEMEPVVIKVDAQDLEGNSMSQYRFAFNELVPVTACGGKTVVACEPCAETLRSAAPETFGVTSWWPWWFVLLCSLILNLKLWTERRTKRQKLPFPADFEKHRIEDGISPKKRKMVKRSQK
jgi:hypothetical protein